MDNATLFLGQKLLETIAEYNVPALAATVVSNNGTKLASAEKGIRKVGASGDQNAIQSTDRFNLGSISKVVTGYLMAKLIQESIGGLKWETTIGDVFPELANLPGWQAAYAAATVQQLLTHTAGFPYEPQNDNPLDYETWTAQDLTRDKLMARRKKYVEAAVIDLPLYPPGEGYRYDGGGIICAAIAEKLTGRTYEELVKKYIYDPLGMASSGFGKLSEGPLDGPWQHTWDANQRMAVPDPKTMLDGYDWNPRNPAGGVSMSAADMGSFLREQLVSSPTVCSVSTRTSAQTTELAPSCVRGAWGAIVKVTEIWHNGDNGRSYALAWVLLDTGRAFAAMCNMNNAFASPAVDEMSAVSRFMLNNWELFEDSAQSFVGCMHPSPALIVSGNNRTLFVRKHDGSAWCKQSSDNGMNWSAATKLPGAVITSGLAAGLSSNKPYLFGRGTDQRIWFSSSLDNVTWQGWAPIGTGTFQTGPSAGTSTANDILHVAAIGMDGLMYYTRSTDGGQTWNGWTPIGAGVFTSAPALAVSADGQTLHAFGRGTDWRIWYNQSANKGDTWQPHWKPIGEGILTSSPAAVVSSDGTVHVASRGTDRHMWRNSSGDSGASWLPHWKAFDQVGTFTSAPALSVHTMGSGISASALGDDFLLYSNEYNFSGDNWSGWSRVSGPATEYYL
jgi:CubicO group peptidase (beta-lactamase class C family)